MRHWLTIMVAGFAAAAAHAEPPLPPPALLDAKAPSLPVLEEKPALTPVPWQPPAIQPFAPLEVPAPAAETIVLPDVGKDPFMEALASAYKNNPALKAQREALAATDEKVAQAISGFRPSIVAGYGKGRQRQAVAGGSWDYQNTTSKTLDVEQPIFAGGENWAAFKSAKDRVLAGRARLQEVEQQVLYDAVVAFTAMVEKQDVLKLNQNNVDVLRRQLETTRSRLDAGELTQTDVAQSEARLAKAQADERLALGDVDAARATFRRVIGYDPPESLQLPAIPPLIPETMNEAIDIAQQANPSLIAARHNESAASTDIDARAAALLPDVDLRGSVSRLEGVNIPGITKLDNDSITVNVTVPLYQSGAEWSRVREARNLAQQAKYQSLDMQDAVIENVTRAWQDYKTASAVIASNQQAVAAAQTALDGVRQENEFGVRTILDVLDAEQETFLAKVNLVKAERVEKVQAYRLLAAIGRLTAGQLQLPAPAYDPKEHYDDVKYQLLGL